MSAEQAIEAVRQDPLLATTGCIQVLFMRRGKSLMQLTPSTAHTAKKNNKTPSVEPLFLPNTTYFVDILSGQRAGEGALPCELGLSTEQFEAMVNRHLSGVSCLVGHSNRAKERGTLRQQLLDMRHEEWQDLQQLLIQHRADRDESESWMAAIIAAACLGNNHLWRDLGLSSRARLKQLLFENFPALALENTRDMRWKKFLYRQLCEQQGHYICRSPSCEICPTYSECFGDES